MNEIIVRALGCIIGLTIIISGIQFIQKKRIDRKNWGYYLTFGVNINGILAIITGVIFIFLGLFFILLFIIMF